MVNILSVTQLPEQQDVRADKSFFADECLQAPKPDSASLSEDERLVQAVR